MSDQISPLVKLNQILIEMAPAIAAYAKASAIDGEPRGAILTINASITPDGRAEAVKDGDSFKRFVHLEYVKAE